MNEIAGFFLRLIMVISIVIALNCVKDKVLSELHRHALEVNIMK